MARCEAGSASTCDAVSSCYSMGMGTRAARPHAVDHQRNREPDSARSAISAAVFTAGAMEMMVRWAVTALIEASRQFRKLCGYAGMTKLVAALRAHDATLDRTVDRDEKAA